MILPPMLDYTCVWTISLFVWYYCFLQKGKDVDDVQEIHVASWNLD